MSKARKVRIWSVDPPGSLVAALFDNHGHPRDEDCAMPLVKLKASYVETEPGKFPVGPLLRADQIAKYGHVL